MIYLVNQDDVSSITKIVSQPIDCLGLKENILNILKSNNIYLIEDIVRCNRESILKMPMMGKTKLNEIMEKLQSVNLDFKILDRIPKELLEAHYMAHRISKALKDNESDKNIIDNFDILSKEIYKLGVLSERTINFLRLANIKYAYEIFMQEEGFYKKIKGLTNSIMKDLKNLEHSLNINLGVKYPDNILNKIKEKIEFNKIANLSSFSSTRGSIKGTVYVKKENINGVIFKADLFISRDYYEKFSNYLKNNLTEKFYIEFSGNKCLEVPVSSILKNNTHLDTFIDRLMKFENKKTLEEIAVNHGLTRERIRQIEKIIVSQLLILGINLDNLVDLKKNVKKDSELKFNEKNFLNFDLTEMNTLEINGLKKFRLKVMIKYFNHILDEDNTISKQYKEMCEEFFSIYDGYENFFTMRQDKSPIGSVGKLYFILYKLYYKKNNERPTVNISYNDDPTGDKRARSHRCFLGASISHMQGQWREGRLNQESKDGLKDLEIAERFEKTHWTADRIKNLLKKIAIEELKDPYVCPSTSDIRDYGKKYDPKFKFGSFLSAAKQQQIKNGTEVLTWPMVAKKYGFDAVQIWTGNGPHGEFKVFNIEEAIKNGEK
tara:strand:+ start:5691 stop:7505 length:1815 start_codon:yes stop_codon:yes gene_type:complete